MQYIALIFFFPLATGLHALLLSPASASGLDTHTAYSIVSLLRDIAHDQQKTVVCTIHQPSSDIFHMFDDLILMASGEIMYHGPAQTAVPYFARFGYDCPKSFNPSDWFFVEVLYSVANQLKMIEADMDEERDMRGTADRATLIARKGEREAEKKAAFNAMQEEEKARIAGLLKQWKASPEHATLQATLAHPLTSPLPDPSLLRAARPSDLYAFQQLSKRRWHDLMRHPMKLRVQCSQYIFFALLLGLIFLQQGHNQKSVQNRTGETRRHKSNESRPLSLSHSLSLVPLSLVVCYRHAFLRLRSGSVHAFLLQSSLVRSGEDDHDSRDGEWPLPPLALLLQPMDGRAALPMPIPAHLLKHILLDGRTAGGRRQIRAVLRHNDARRQLRSDHRHVTHLPSTLATHPHCFHTHAHAQTHA